MGFPEYSYKIVIVKGIRGHLECLVMLMHGPVDSRYSPDRTDQPVCKVTYLCWLDQKLNGVLFAGDRVIYIQLCDKLYANFP